MALRFGCLVCPLSLIRGLGRCGTDVWMSGVFLSLIGGLGRCGTEVWMSGVFPLTDWGLR